MSTANLSRKQIFIMAITAGICVANIYYIQPIFHDIAKSLQVDVESIGIISVLSQAGYGLGLFLITPLGDKIDRKHLIILLETGLTLVLLVMTFTSNLLVLYTAGFLIGLCAVAAQVILPMAASMVTKNRGGVVGIIFTGILVGVLVSRIFSGYISIWFGWRYIYGFSAALVAFSAVLIHLNFDKTLEEPFQGSYKSLLRSTLYQFKRFKSLRRTAFIGALTFGTFSSFWIVLTFHLGGAPFNFESDTIGLFGILAIVGILLVPAFGKLADKNNNPNSALLIALLLVIVGIIALFLKPFLLPIICLAIVLIDIGVQATQVTNIAFIYTLDESANSRINTVYMTSYFTGGALGASFSIWCWDYGGWNWVMFLMAGFTLLALVQAALAKRASATQLKKSNRIINN